MGTRYAVLYGANGVKDFKKLDNAKLWARRKANSSKKNVDIDKITTYPKARKGETDWSQRNYLYIKPSGRKFYKYTDKKV